MKVRIHEEAVADLLACIRFYDSRPAKYGRAMKVAFDRAVAAIGWCPGLYPLVEDDLPGFEVREHYIERFKQRIVFRVDPHEVRVLAVVHASRRSGSWHGRLTN